MAETHKVAIKGSSGSFAFDPGSITIKAGDTVEWTNETSAPHTATADGGEFDSGRLRPGAPPFSHTFNAPDNIDYHCEIHPSMTGTVIVT
jgi:plastocyanin